MNFPSQRALECAVTAARAAGGLMRGEKAARKKIKEQSQHDIKLELDVRSQKLIEKILSASFPQAAVLGEEGVSGRQDAPLRWVIDPIDGTVNFAYGIPHACVSIALQKRGDGGEFATEIGVVYDPFCDELWTAVRGGPARLNGKIIRASRRKVLAEAIVAIGFSKTRESLQENLPVFNALVRRVRKIRMMGAAALALT
jgi:myo-inositol-1(or 4)-monophosphatase